MTVLKSLEESFADVAFSCACNVGDYFSNNSEKDGNA